MINRETDAEQIAHEPEDLFRLFVYGTLKRGYWNHDRFCRNAVSVEEASVQGRLYELPSGIPVLKVPDETILAVGTVDASADVATQESAALPTNISASGEWSMIQGELLAFSDSTRDMPPIDRLESYRPGRFSLYRRVLVPVISIKGEVTAAWSYTGTGEMVHHCVPMEGTLWP